MTERKKLSDAVTFLIERAHRHGAESAESFGVDSLSMSAECRLQKTESLEYAQTSGVDLRVFVGRRQAVVSSSILDEKTLDELAERAVEMARAVPEDPYCGLADPALLATEFPDADLCDPYVPTPEKLLETAMIAEEAALSVPGVTNSSGAGASYDGSEIIMASTSGFFRSYRRSGSSFSVSVVAEDKNGLKETDYDFSSAVYFSDLEPTEAIGKRAGERTVRRLGARKIDSGRMSILLEPRLAKGLVGTFASAINGAAVARGTSFLKDSLEAPVFADNVSILEDPHRRRSPASRPCDAEGLPTRERALVDRGILTTWLLDLRSARQLALEPTGHAARGLGGIPHPSASNLTLAGGTLTPEELMADITHGLYLTNLFGQGINMITGDYSRGASGFLIENGKITLPVHEITVAGNLKDMFRRLVPANDIELRSAVRAPTVRLDDISVAGK